MTKSKRLVNFYVETNLWKNFSKKCIDEGKTKSEILVEMIKKYVGK